MLHTWGQSYLAGVPKIVFGMRDDSGVVKELRKYDTFEIPKFIKKHNLWKENVALNFLNEFLDFLKKSVTIDDPNAVYILEFKKPYKDISIKLLGDDTEKILPKWYVDAAKDLSLIQNQCSQRVHVQFIVMPIQIVFHLSFWIAK